jgi:hypothetical protein
MGTNGTFIEEEGDIVRLDARPGKTARSGWINVGAHAIWVELNDRGDLVVEAHPRGVEGIPLMSQRVPHARAVAAGGHDVERQRELQEIEAAAGHAFAAVDDLEGHALNHAVALALGAKFEAMDADRLRRAGVQPTWLDSQPVAGIWSWPTEDPGLAVSLGASTTVLPDFSADDGLAGKIAFGCGIEINRVGPGEWEARIDLGEGDAMVESRHADSPRIAALRCFVACRLGDVVQLPEVLLQECAESTEQDRRSHSQAG